MTLKTSLHKSFFFFFYACFEKTTLIRKIPPKYQDEKRNSQIEHI